MVNRLEPIAIFRGFSRGKHFLAGVPLKKKGIDAVDAEQFNDKPILVYFSAGWCGQCKTLTPKIKKFYEGLGGRQNEMEVVWISNDKEADHQMDYYEKMPGSWNYIPFGDPNMKKLSEKYKAAVIPVMKIVNSKGDVISDRARAEVEEYVKKDPTTALDQWKSKV